MEYEPDGAQELLIDSAQERTARRTEHLLLAARLVFFFFHGLLIISVSLGMEDVSWWVIFTPAWMGNALCFALVILSWFGSCPYIQSCLQERQARLGDSNPSILTDILPDIVMGIISLVYMILTLVAELLLCRYLDELTGSEPAVAAPATFLILVSMLTCCRGLCIFTSSALFGFVGSAALATCILALVLPKPLNENAWAMLVPWAVAVSCLGISAFWHLRCYRAVLCREELILRTVELFVLALVLLSVLALVFELSSLAIGDGIRYAGIAGVAAGTGVCTLSALHMRMAMVECRNGAISDRLLTAEMCRRDPGASLLSSVISGVGVEVGGDLSLSAARSGPGSWRSGRMVRVSCPQDAEAPPETSDKSAACPETPDQHTQL
mmetsp:Transcript_1644/g.4165  ORF Transcript_1644/g.4165 Transcript_1644/m.4165 type:complete len:382 (-) Transcript_1644:34-1179(-)